MVTISNRNEKFDVILRMEEILTFKKTNDTKIVNLEETELK